MTTFFGGDAVRKKERLRMKRISLAEGFHTFLTGETDTHTHTQVYTHFYTQKHSFIFVNRPTFSRSRTPRDRLFGGF